MLLSIARSDLNRSTSTTGRGRAVFLRPRYASLSERILEFGAISERPSLHISASGLTALALVVQNVEFVGFKKTPGNAVR